MTSMHLESEEGIGRDVKGGHLNVVKEAVEFIGLQDRACKFLVAETFA
jgi:hypothetical protein